MPHEIPGRGGTLPHSCGAGAWLPIIYTCPDLAPWEGLPCLLEGGFPQTLDRRVSPESGTQMLPATVTHHPHTLVLDTIQA